MKEKENRKGTVTDKRNNKEGGHLFFLLFLHPPQARHPTLLTAEGKTRIRPVKKVDSEADGHNKSHGADEKNQESEEDSRKILKKEKMHVVQIKKLQATQG